ncbi:hypothetical protein ACQEU3_18320 [Spirillospora sp. CA-253888]
MVFLGLILVAAAVAAAVGVALGDTGPITLTVFGEQVPGVTDAWQVFFAGAAVAVVLIVGMMLVFVGAGRSWRARRDLRELRAEHEESLTTLEMEKRRLQQELAQARRADPARQRATAAAGTAPRSQVSAASPFFDRAD